MNVSQNPGSSEDEPILELKEKILKGALAVHIVGPHFERQVHSCHLELTR